MALAAVLAGETQVVLRQADLAKRVVVAEGHPQEALVHLEQIFLLGESEKCPELVAFCMCFETSAEGGEQSGGSDEHASHSANKNSSFMAFFTGI